MNIYLVLSAFTSIAKPANSVNTLDDQIQGCNVEMVGSCSKCALLKNQLLSAIQELKSAEAIISLLQEDIKYNSLVTSSDIQMPALTVETKEPNLTSERWSTVVHKTNKKNQTNSLNAANVKFSCVSVNRFAPLSPLNESQSEEAEYVPQSKHPQSIQLSMRTKLHWSQGSKIPTIVNGMINGSADKKTNKKSSNRLYTHDHKSIKPLHKVKIIGDSHLRG